MASIHKELNLAAPPALVWEALRDVGAVHQRLARGFVVSTTHEGEYRDVTFANGMRVRERIITVDDAARLLVYAAEGGRLSYHNASFTVVDDGSGGSKLLWTAHLLPADMAPAIDGMMTAGLEVMRTTLEADALAARRR